jgi:hypothetical protein
LTATGGGIGGGDAGGHGGGQVQINGAIIVPTDPSQPTVPGIQLTIDGRGVVVQWGSTEPRALPWDSVVGWRVDPYDIGGQPGAIVTVQTHERLFRFAAPGGDTASLGYVVDDLCRHYRRLASMAPAATATPGGAVADGAPGGPAAPSATMAAEPATGAQLARWQPVLVVVLVVFLAAAVALILAQSAGAIHWPILGGGSGTRGGGGTTGGLVLPVWAFA